jgi:MFS family permease
MRHRSVRVLRQTFASLANPNYRLYFGGQAVSLVGTWMQSVAQSWLVLQLTHSGAWIGLVVATQTLPVLLLGPYGGVLADRLDKRRLMVALQSLMGVQALILGVLTVSGLIQLWEVFVLALVLGLNNTFENPARQAFVLEMVGPRDLRNAVSLNSVLVNAARAVGPAAAGVVIATGGVGVCFLVNAASFVAVVSSLVRMDLSRLRPSPLSGRHRGQLREGLRYVGARPALAVPLVMMALIGTFTYEFTVVLPVVAERTLHGGSQTYGFLTAAMGGGAVLGGLITASRGRTGLRPLVLGACGFGVVMVAAAVAPSLGFELAALAFVGAASVSFLAMANSTLQLTASPSMRGRVMALWAVAFLGSTPIGGPVAGWVTDSFGARYGLAMGALACFLAAAVGAVALRALGRRAAGVAGPAAAVSEGDAAGAPDTATVAVPVDAAADDTVAATVSGRG